MRYVTDALVPFFKSVSTGADKKRSAHSGTVGLPGFLIALHTRAKELWALKFAPKETLIGNLMDGRLYIYAAGYFHDLPGEQDDPSEASLAYGMGIYANWLLPIYCMFTVRENDIAKSTVVITRRMIDKFRCADGWIGIVRHACFERFLHRKASTTSSTFRKKGNTLLSKASPLKLPQSFCMIARYATPSRRDVRHRESPFLVEQTPWMRRPNCHRRIEAFSTP